MSKKQKRNESFKEAQRQHRITMSYAAKRAIDAFVGVDRREEFAALMAELSFKDADFRNGCVVFWRDIPNFDDPDMVLCSGLLCNPDGATDVLMIDVIGREFAEGKEKGND